MIDGIRRRLSKSIDRNPWDAERELEHELDESYELSTETAVLVAAKHGTGEFSPFDGNTQDYFKSLVSTAIENGGWHGGHQIPIPWLRMILAGLESKHIEPEMMWYGMEAGESSRDPLPDVPTYHDLFPPNRSIPAVHDP